MKPPPHALDAWQVQRADTEEMLNEVSSAHDADPREVAAGSTRLHLALVELADRGTASQWMRLLPGADPVLVSIGEPAEPVPAVPIGTLWKAVAVGLAVGLAFAFGALIGRG